MARKKIVISEEKELSSDSVSPSIRLVGHGEPIPRGFVRRPHPVYPEFVCHCSWWPNQIHQRNGDPDMVYLWIPRKDDLAYRRTHVRTRFCRTYRGESCEVYRKRVIVAAKC